MNIILMNIIKQVISFIILYYLMLTFPWILAFKK